MGKTGQFAGQDYQVTGIIENCPQHSHIQYDFIFSLNSLKQVDENDWGQHAIETYILLGDHASVQNIEAQLPAFVKRHLFQSNTEALDRFSAQGFYYQLWLQPLLDVYLNPTVVESLGPRGNRENLAILTAIGLFILTIAGINYINLTTSLSFTRNKEVAIRRLLGSNRGNVIVQLLIETLIITTISFQASSP